MFTYAHVKWFYGQSECMHVLFELFKKLHCAYISLID